MKTSLLHIFHFSFFILNLSLFSSCDLLEPGDVQNPNVEENDFANSTDAMTLWVNGANARFAVGVSTIAELTGILSDDLYNSSSRSSKIYDVLDIHYTDTEVSKLSTRIGEMIEMADFGLETVAKRDEKATDAQRLNLYYIKACAYLYGSENFVALPREASGKVLDSEGLAQEALRTLSEASVYVQNAADQALLSLLEARAYRLLGQWGNATTAASRSLQQQADMAMQVQFDALNGFANSLQEYVSTELFTLLPRLSFLKEKFPKADECNQPITFAKSEEAYLILAEARLLDASLNDSQRVTAALPYLSSLLELIAQRDATISATSVTATELAAMDPTSATARTGMLSLLYRLRQEVFVGEGRRSADLGIRLPISEVEFLNQGNLPDAYRFPIIPAYLESIRSEIDQHEDLNDWLATQE